jgi:NAD(P)-dependent dehydrogenase (short-subunit alcohol dehydrogenase family)
MSDRTEQRVALVTGSNKGIGFEAARQLGRLGIRVLISARDPGRGSAAAEALAGEGIQARSVVLDVTDAASIEATLDDLQKNEGRLDILVNNAGIGLEHYRPSELATAKLRETMETNFFGVVAVTQKFLPMLGLSPAGRIVNVSSSLASLLHLSDPEWIGSRHQFPAYSISKTALNAWTAVLSCELHGGTTKVNSVEPGYTATDLTSGQGFQSASDAARVIVKYATIGPDGPNGGYFELNGRMPW